MPWLGGGCLSLSSLWAVRLTGAGDGAEGGAGADCGLGVADDTRWWVAAYLERTKLVTLEKTN